ncbi:MAG TPA: nitrile hydratase subunit beta [Chloroflexota bacterium]|nr:nitrile hydratase subunit beta [Chloroflexota bacterium]
MNHVHDMGGRTDFGPIAIEPDEPLFHAEWERRVMGLVRTTVDKRYNWDEFRFAIERLDPPVYLGASYYERWLSALERFLIEKGVVGEAELRERTAGTAPRPGLPHPGSGALWTYQAETPKRFEPGDEVVARTIDPVGHTRLPGYVRGKRGTIDRYLGDFIFPDRNALGAGEDLQPVYVVRFEGTELWGDAARAGDSVCVDLWHSYLQPTNGGTVT